MALIAKSSFHLAIAFFLLGDKLDSAVRVAIDRCKDPVLAVLVCRLVDPEDKSGEMKKLTQTWFIERGEKFNDPYLVNMGHWL
jgi:hypothetical protein